MEMQLSSWEQYNLWEFDAAGNQGLSLHFHDSNKGKP